MISLYLNCVGSEAVDSGPLVSENSKVTVKFNGLSVLPATSRCVNVGRIVKLPTPISTPATTKTAQSFRQIVRHIFGLNFTSNTNYTKIA